ncbi:MAG: hypothetical protein V4850_24790 [Myxococcota bacterium]
MYLFLSACADAPHDTAEEDVGIVTITCTYSYVTGGEPASGTYPGFTTDCDGWASSGYQSMGSTQSACEQAGLDGGADEAACACEVDTGTCTFPGGVND